MVHREQHECGRLEGIFCRQNDPPVIDPTLELRITRTVDGELPLENILLHPSFLSEWPAWIGERRDHRS